MIHPGITSDHLQTMQAGASELDDATVFLMDLPQPLSPFLATTLLLMHHVAKVSTASVWRSSRAA